MKPEIHPEYHEVVFLDASVNPPLKILTRSTRKSEETIEWDDGTTYPVIRVEISSASHPFYTGKQKLLDTAGMVERYRKRYGLAQDDENEEEDDQTPVESTADPAETAESTETTDPPEAGAETSAKAEPKDE